MTRHFVLWLTFSFLVLDLATARAAAPLFDDFEHGDLVSGSGSAWVPIGDDLFGGATTLRLEAIRGGAHRSKGALRLTANVAASPGAVAGAWTSLVPGGRRADLTRLDAVRLSVRGPAHLLVGIRGGDDPGTNFMAPVDAGPEWTTVTVRFADLRAQGKDHEHDAFNPALARFIGVSSAPGATGAFSVSVDDVALVDAAGKPGTGSFDPGEPPRSRALLTDDAAPLGRLLWRELARDGEGDGRAGLPDARALFVAREKATGLAWFRVDLAGPLPESWIGVNIVLDTDGDPSNGMAWWGGNRAFHFDRIATAYVWCNGRRCDGPVGFVTSDDVAKGRMTNDAGIHLALDRTARRVYLGLPLADLEALPDVRVVAAVGSAMLFGDDLPDTGAARLDSGPKP